MKLRASIFRSALAIGVALTGLQHSVVAGEETDEIVVSLEDSFREPPQEARPRVWWHWLNGNVTKDGIAKDLAWMKRTGIGGVQTFDVNFQTPDVVEKRLAYMTSEWKEAFRFAAEETDRLGLELTVATSPGWSLTGGPWVKPEDGLKKIVWSETIVDSEASAPIRLVAPPTVSGPFQDIPLKPEPGADPDHVTPEDYDDIAVLAFPFGAHEALPTPQFTLHDGKTLDAALLTDGKLADGATILRDKDGNASITIAYDTPQTVRSLVAYLPGSADMFSGPAFDMVLESSDDGAQWREVAQFRPTLAPSTIGFAPVTARLFRLRMTAIDTLSPIDLVSAPGYAGMNYSMYVRQMPFKVAELRLQAEPKLDQFEAKAGFGIARNYYALDTSGSSDEAGVSRKDIVYLSDKLQPDGTLDWKPAKGKWRVLRFGWSLTGKTNHPAPAEATGLEVDKLDGDAVRDYMEQYISSYRDAVGPDLIGERGINAILTDSTEIGAFNWTPAMIDAFKRLRGYDPLFWLPALAGTVVESRAKSDRFLYDFRRTIADLHASEHYGAVAEVAHEAGLKVYGEALEGWRVSLGDDIDMRRYTDFPMAAMWAWPAGMQARPLLVADVRTAASSAHLRGKPIVAAESMTSSRFPWAMGPAELRRVVDTEFAHGINRIIVHTSPHQPVDDKRPGLSLRHIGQFFTRHETWADMARPWIDYIARSSYLLQQGRFAADVAYFPGEEAPVPTLVAEGGLKDLPHRYGYDFVNANAIIEDFAVDNGHLVTKGGARYSALFLGGTSGQMTVPVLRRIYSLARQGATIIGNAPLSTPSLADDPKEFARLVRRMWRNDAVTQLGKGRVIKGTNVEDALATIGIAPDFDGADPKEKLEFVHRELADGHIYYIRNGSDEPRSIDARFRVSGKAPELWNAVTGTIRPLSYRMDGAQTVVPLELSAEDSSFVVFREPSQHTELSIPANVLENAGNIEGPWRVSFQKDRGARPKIDMASLAPLNESDDADIRYFSGVASYTTEFSYSPDSDGSERLVLDLGKVGDIAEVRINGELAGTAWQAPYKIDVTGLARAGLNTLEIKVANLWVNRLIGDAQDGADQVAWTAGKMYNADAPLRPAGLIGPVRLMIRREAP